MIKRKVSGIQQYRIHFISLLAGYSWGGSEELWSQSASQLLEKGHNVSACINCHGPKGLHPRVAALENQGLVVHEWNRPQDPKRWPRRLTAQIGSKIRHMKRSNIVSSPWFVPNNADLIVINSPGIGFSYPLIRYCIERRIRYVLVCQSVSESEWLGDSEFTQWQTIYKNAEAVYFVSRANLESACCQLAYRGQHFEVVHNPYTTTRSLAFSWPMSSELRKIAFVGRLQPEHKGIDLLLRALATGVWRERLIQLNIYGEGRSAKQLREMVRYLNLEDKVVFHGFISDVDRVWDENEMLVLPSRHEGLPLVVIEALTRGRPCLVTDVSGNAEYVTDSVTGFVAAGATLYCVAETLERAWRNRDLWRDMGRSAFDEIRKKFPADPVEEFTARIIKRCSHIAANLTPAQRT